MQKKILVVEDDQFFREALKDLLKKKYAVLEAPNGKSAKDILTMQDVDLVLSDIQMPNLTGVELLEWSKQYKPLPFVIMTGFSTILETKSAFDLGAQGFIAKPFKNSELLATLENLLNPSQGETNYPVADPLKDYCKVSIEEFVAKPKIDFDVYIRLSENKVIKLAHKGQEIPRDKVALYKEKGVKYLHILKEDFSKLVDFNLDLAKIIKNRDEISVQKKLNFLKYTGEVLLEKTFKMDLENDSFLDAKSYIDIALNTIAESNDCLDLLSVLNSHSDVVYAHSLGVSLYAVMIARKMNYESHTALFKLSLAGFFHDIGKKEIDREILEKPRHLVTKEERNQIESHVVRGQEILNAMRGIPSEVALLVFEHHEDQSGLGYPLRKNKLEQHPMSKILQTANIFMDCIMSEQFGTYMSGPSGVAYMEKIYGDRVDASCLKALKSLFTVKARAGIAGS